MISFLSCCFWLQMLATKTVQLESDVVAHFGGDVTLSCLFPSQPGMNLQDLTLTWQKEQAGAEALVVHCHYYGREQLEKQDEAYRNRTRLDPEGLAWGNASLTLRGVRTQDKGVYLCHVTSEPGWTAERRELRVEAPYSEPHLTLDLSFRLGHTLLTFSSGGGYPRASVAWRDGNQPDRAQHYHRVRGRPGPLHPVQRAGRARGAEHQPHRAPGDSARVGDPHAAHHSGSRTRAEMEPRLAAGGLSGRRDPVCDSGCVDPSPSCPWDLWTLLRESLCQDNGCGGSLTPEPAGPWHLPSPGYTHHCPQG
ncbi:CD276 antigen-like [Chrysemys picta bellii]|uniref:CD276 antigen-like n=1 Tax=Chrysemys picta bellii TaxID=8478 RepID=UPI0032B16831